MWGLARTLGVLVLLLSLGQADGALYSAAACNNALKSAGNGLTWSKFSQVLGTSIGGNTVVTVPCGQALELDVDLPPLKELRVEGYLKVPGNKGAFSIHAEGILVTGKLVVSSEAEQMSPGSSLTIVMKESGGSLRYMKNGVNQDGGEMAFVVAGGQLDMHGVVGGSQCVTKTWTSLAKAVKKGSNKLIVEGDVRKCWLPGMRMAITTTDDNIFHAETVIIASTALYGGPSISGAGNVLTEIMLLEKFEHDHRVERYNSAGRSIVEAAKVGLISRGISITSEVGNDGSDPLIGSHLMIDQTNLVNVIEGVEFTYGGQQGVLGRYPAHWHMCQDASGSIFRANSVRDSNQRGMVIHGTHNLLVEHNVFYNIRGHGILLEDRIETGNVIRFNIGFLNHWVERLIKIDGEDESDNIPTMFWLTNPDNVVTHNVASGCAFSGFWFELDDEIRGLSKKFDTAEGIDPRHTDLGTFAHNEAHGNWNTGFRTYPNGFLPSNPATFRDLFSWGNGLGFFVHITQNLATVDSIFADNKNAGVEWDFNKNVTLENSLIAGMGSAVGRMFGCPKQGALIVDGQAWGSNLSGNRAIGVDVDKFSGCSGHPIRHSTNEDSKGIFTASNVLQNINFVDMPRSAITDLPKPSSTTDEAYQFPAFLLKGIYHNGEESDKSDGYVVPKERPIMWEGPGDEQCILYAGNTKFCKNTCFRSMLVGGDAPAAGRYKLRINRTADNVVDETLPMQADTWFYFYFNLRAGHSYIIELIQISNGAVIVAKNWETSYVDGAEACNGSVTLLFSQHGVIFGSNTIMKKPCEGSTTSVQPLDAVAYDRCFGGKIYRVVEMPAIAMPEFVDGERATRISFGMWHMWWLDYTRLNSDCNGAVPVSKCMAFERNSVWKYDDSGIDLDSEAATPYDNLNFSEGDSPLAFFNFDQEEVAVATQLRNETYGYYMAKSFTVDDASCIDKVSVGAAQFFGILSDGYIVSLNGVEIWRFNVPEGNLTPDDIAIDAQWGPRRWDHEYVIQGAMSSLKNGKNTLFVELHRFHNKYWSQPTDCVSLDIQMELTMKDSCL